MLRKSETYRALKAANVAQIQSTENDDKKTTPLQVYSPTYVDLPNLKDVTGQQSSLSTFLANSDGFLRTGLTTGFCAEFLLRKINWWRT